MAETKMGQRVAAITLAVLFLVTSLGFSGLVIWDMHQQNKKEAATNAALDKVNNSTTNESTEGKLAGTKLKDFTPGTNVTDVQKTDLVEGTGDEVKVGDTITAHYTGALVSDGTIFQSSHDGGQPFTAQLAKGSLIDGWIEGIPGMKVGGTRRLVIPAAKAYGKQAQDGIPANSDLVFDVELIKIGE